MVRFHPSPRPNPIPKAPPVAPAGVVATVVSSVEIDLSWNLDKQATSYKVERSPDGSSGWAQIGSVTVLSFADKGLQPSTNYFYRVRASNRAGNSPYSTVVSGTTTAANSYFVATTGSDGAAGTIGAPFATIAHALGLMHAGDALFLRAGTYTQSIRSGVPTGTSWAAPVTISAYQSEVVTLRPNDGGARVVNLQTDISYVQFLNLVFDATGTISDCVKITKGGGATTGANHIRLSGCELKNYQQNGILVTDESGGDCRSCEFLNLIVHDGLDLIGSPGHYHGIYNVSSNNLIDGCTIYNVQAMGIQIFSSAGRTNPGGIPQASNTIVRNCIVHDAGKDGVVFSPGILSGTGDSNHVYNNLIYSCPNGIQTGQGDTNSLIEFNTVYGSSRYGLDLAESGTSTGSTWKNNVSYQNATRDWIAQGGQTATLEDYNLCGDNSLPNLGGHDLLGTNPIFLNQSIADFRLGSISLALAAGVTSGVTVDLLGGTRTSPPSMGAYDPPFTRTPLVFYADPVSGSDSNPGSLASPFLTIAKGLKQLAPADTLDLRAGTFAEAMLTIPGGLDGAHMVTVRAHTGETVTVQPPALSSASAVAYFASAGRKYISLQNLVLDAVNLATNAPGASCVTISTGSGGSGGTSHHITLSGCTIKNAPKDGVHISSNSDSNTVKNCVFSANGGSGNAAVFVNSANNTIKGNDLTGSQFGCEISYDTEPTNGNLVDSNKAHGCTVNGLYCNSGTGNQLSNNLVYGNTNAGIVIAASGTSPPSGTLVYFNSLYGNNASHSDAAALSLLAGGSGAVVKDNIMENLASNKDYKDAATGTVSDYNCTKDATGVGANTKISTDPLFNAPGSNDFTLQAGSPCKHAGLTIAGITKDFAGTTRTSPPSMGAYE